MSGLQEVGVLDMSTKEPNIMVALHALSSIAKKSLALILEGPFRYLIAH